jgi:predicted nuclease with RNAse H fold
MAFQTRDEAQDKFSRKVDRTLFKKKKPVPLSQESWDDLNRRGASLAEQFEWIRLDGIKKDREVNNKL